MQAVAVEPMRQVTGAGHRVKVSTNEHSLGLSSVRSRHQCVAVTHQLQMCAAFPAAALRAVVRVEANEPERRRSPFRYFVRMFVVCSLVCTFVCFCFVFAFWVVFCLFVCLFAFGWSVGKLADWFAAVAWAIVAGAAN